MLMQDRIQVERWIQSNATLGDVLDTSAHGLVDNERFTYRAKRFYIRLWTWGAVRYSGRASEEQEQFYKRMGKDAFFRRIDRTQAIISKIQKRG